MAAALITIVNNVLNLIVLCLYYCFVSLPGIHDGAVDIGIDADVGDTYMADMTRQFSIAFFRFSWRMGILTATGVLCFS